MYAKYNTNKFKPKKISVASASDNVARIGADITAGSFLNFMVLIKE
nr:hypothetical protein [Mycoplasmopsis felis]